MKNLLLIGAAATPDMTAAITGSMEAIKNDVSGAISAVAPIAISIMGMFLVWRYGIKFFKGLSK